MRVESLYEIKGKELILRNPEESDAERLLNENSRETPYLIRSGGDHPHLEEEKEFIWAEQLKICF